MGRISLFSIILCIFAKKNRKESAKGEEPFVRSGCGFAEKLLNIKIE